MCLQYPQRALKTLTLDYVLEALSKSLDSPPKSRREIGGDTPHWRPEAAAAQRLIGAGLMGGLLDCLSIFFKLAHADDPDADGDILLGGCGRIHGGSVTRGRASLMAMCWA